MDPAGGLAITAAGLNLANEVYKAFSNPETAKDLLSGKSVDEIIDVLEEAVGKLRAIKTDFQLEQLRNKKRGPSQRYLEWVHLVEKIDRQVNYSIATYNKKKVKVLFPCFPLSVGPSSVCFNDVAGFKEKFKNMYMKVYSLLQESNQIKDNMFVGLLPKRVKYMMGPDINFGTPEKKIKEILDLLESSKVKIIGIQGIVGIGKTAMMRNLNNNEKVAAHFDIVIWLKVSLDGSSKNLSREHLQHDIVRRLKLNSVDEVTSSNPDEVAERILNELEGKKYLLLLDDVKECLNLENIGIPVSNNGCKIVLTTRLPQVCVSMVDRIIPMTRLSLDEAWTMFRDVLESDGVIKNSEILKMARLVCKDCSGIPLLIQKVARTFRSKTSEIHWSEGLNSFRKLPRQYREGIKEMYNSLKFCYDDLDDESRQKCFLYVALYPEDSEINADYLLECWAAEKLPGGNDTQESLKCGHDVLDDLKKSSLLEECEIENHVTMHKSIRQMALDIVKGDGESEYLVETSKGLTNPTEEGSWTNKKRVSFGDNNLKDLPDSPNCGMLSTLILQRNLSLETIPQSFFQHMIELRVLDVSDTGIKELPSSLSTSIELKVLYLNNCKSLVELPPHVVEKLTHLEALGIVGSGVNNIPSHIKKLTRLRRLWVSFSESGNENATQEVNSNYEDISEISRLEELVIKVKSLATRLRRLRISSSQSRSATQEVNFNYEVISKLSKLEVLVITVKSLAIWSDDVEENIMKEVAKLKEFKSLKFCFPDDKVVDVIEVVGSQNLRIRVPDATILLSFIENSSWKNVRGINKFEFYIGPKKSEQSQLPNFDKYEKYVKYCEVEGPRHSPILEVLAEADAFELVDNNNIKQLSDSELTNLKGIQSCLFEGCDAIETIVGTSDIVVLPSLEHLFMKNLKMLKSIFKGPFQSGSLTKLTTLELTGCRSLVTIFPPDSIQQLCEIQCLKIEKCDEIVEIIPTSGAGGILLPKLKKMILLDMGKLGSICASETLNWPSLEVVKIFECPGLLKLPFNKDNAKILKRIDADPEWWGKLQFEQNNENKEWLQKVRNRGIQKMLLGELLPLATLFSE